MTMNLSRIHKGKAMTYDGASIHRAGEEERQRRNNELPLLSPGRNLEFRPGVILKLVEGRQAVVLLDDGEVVGPVRVTNRFEELRWFYGDDVRDVPCLLFFRHEPEDGFVTIGNIDEETDPNTPDEAGWYT